MLCIKKLTGHDDEEDEESEEKPFVLNFAWIVFMGMRFGYTEKEIGRMYHGKWLDLFQEFKQYHNMLMERKLFKEEEKEVSVFDIK